MISNRMQPPVVLVFTMITMFLMHKNLPGFQIIKPEFLLLKLFGTMFVCFGLAMVIWAKKHLDQAGTSFRAYDEPKILVKSGPYSFTRNPIYLGMILVLFGLFFFMGSSMPLVMVFIFGAVIEQKFITPEEDMLKTKFQKDYIEYKLSVSKWFPSIKEFAYEKKAKK